MDHGSWRKAFLGVIGEEVGHLPSTDATAHQVVPTRERHWACTRIIVALVAGWLGVSDTSQVIARAPAQ